MKYLLITIIIASWLGGVIATLAIWQRHQDYSALAILPLIAVLDGLCAIYLYKRAGPKKVEWALFGFLGNVTAILVFWLVKDVRARWSKGQRYSSQT